MPKQNSSNTNFYFCKPIFGIFFCVAAVLFFYSCDGSDAVSIKNNPLQIKKDSVAPPPIQTVIYNSEKGKLLNTLFKNKVKTFGFNGCVLIAQKGQIIYKNVFGFSNLKTKDSLKINSAFQLASTSKPFTAAAILLLSERAQLNLNDNIQKFFPGFPFGKITIQMLLNHRSGLSNYVYFGEPFCDANNCYNGKIFDNSSVISIMTNKKIQPYAPPNKKFGYCNTNYALLASIIEKVSGLTYAEFMSENIFKPLKMNDTWVYNPINDSLCKNNTVGHNASGFIEMDKYADAVVGDKGIYSTVDDLFKWDEGLYSEVLLKKTSLEQSFKGYSNEHKGKRNYGYGWRLVDDGKGNKIVYHNGWWHGYSSLFFRRLSDHTTVIILSNKFNPNIYHIDDILALLNNNNTSAKNSMLLKSSKK